MRDIAHALNLVFLFDQHNYEFGHLIKKILLFLQKGLNVHTLNQNFEKIQSNFNFIFKNIVKIYDGGICYLCL